MELVFTKPYLRFCYMQTPIHNLAYFKTLRNIESDRSFMTLQTGIDLSQADIVCLNILIDEGIFLQRIIRHHYQFPNYSFALSLIALPYVALIEHDSIPYVNKKYNCNFAKEDCAITDIRHKTKSLDSRYLDYEKYSKRATAMLTESNNYFRNKGVARFLPSSLVKDIGITYFEELPIYSTYLISNMLGNENGFLNNNIKELCFSIGYNAGSAGRFLYDLAQYAVNDERFFESSEFLVTANDYSYSSLLDSRIRNHTDDDVAFFFLSEQLMRLASIEALRRNQFLEQFIWIKLATIYIYHVHKSLENFKAHIFNSRFKRYYSSDFRNSCSTIFERSHAKLIKKMKPLRNAFVHYDFEKLVRDISIDSQNHNVLLANVIQHVMDIDFAEYKTFLITTTYETVEKLQSIIGFPAYNPVRNKF